MGKFAGGALKLLQTAIYALTFCAAAIVLGFYSYFLAVQADRNVDIPRWEKAVEGMSGAACLYLIFAVILTCCVGGLTFFAFLAIVLDIAFTGAFVAIAVLTRDGVRSCDASTVYTPIGNGAPDSRNGWGDDEKTYSVHLGLACKYNKAAFACSIAGALLFLIAALVQLFLGRHHQREKRFGPSPSNNYTSGSGKRKFWQRRSGPKTTRDAELAAAGGLAAEKHHTIRPSHDTGYTGSTVAPATATYDSHGKPVTPPNNHIHTNGGGYHTAPSVNPYGYDNVRNSATNY